MQTVRLSESRLLIMAVSAEYKSIFFRDRGNTPNVNILRYLEIHHVHNKGPFLYIQIKVRKLIRDPFAGDHLPFEQHIFGLFFKVKILFTFSSRWLR